MDEPEQPERIEIELISHGPVHDRARRLDPRRAAPGAEPDPVDGGGSTGSSEGSAGQPPSAWFGSDQGRLVVTAVGVGVIALLIGWMLGRSGGSDSVAAPAETAPSTTIERRQRPDSPFLTAESLPEVDPEVELEVPDETAPRPTTTIPQPVVVGVEVDPRLAGMPLTLVGIEAGGPIVELDLSSSTLLRRLDTAVVNRDISSLIVGDDWILVPDMNSGMARVLHDDGVWQSADLGDGWQPLWASGTDRFWRYPRDAPYEQPKTFEQVDVTGEPTGETIDLPGGSWAWITDPAGGLVAAVAGRTYSVGPDSAELIGTGELLALSVDRAVFRDCDAELRCGLVVVDRSTGATRAVPSELSGDDPFVNSLYNYVGSNTNPLSPDGQLCALMLGDAVPVFGVIDLDTGSFTELASDVYPPLALWSPDARFLFFLDGGVLHAFGRANGDVFPVSSEPLRWSAVGSRSSDAKPGVDESAVAEESAES